MAKAKFNLDLFQTAINFFNVNNSTSVEGIIEKMGKKVIAQKTVQKNGVLHIDYLLLSNEVISTSNYMGWTAMITSTDFYLANLEI
jgi:hypothetical protein